MLPTTCGEIHDMFTSSIYENDFKRCLASSTQKLIKFESELRDSSIIRNGQITNDVIQKFIYFNDNECFNSVIKPMLLDGVIKSEASSARSGSACLNISLYLIKYLSSLSKKDQTNYCNELKHSISNISNHSNRFRHSDIENVINNSFNLEIQKNILNEIIKNINVRSPVFLNVSKTRDTSIQFSDGFNFKLQVSADALSPDKFWKYNNVNCLIIDGLIETVGEIHHLLDRAAEDKQPYLLFVRRLSDDVRSTIYFNRARNTINLMPIEVGFDENTINILNDISMCCNSDIVSTHKGDIISSAIQSQIVKIKSAVVTTLGVNIINSPDMNSLNSHLVYLTERRDLSMSDESFALFDKRIKSLSSGKVTLNIGTDLSFNDRLSVEKFDKFFRELRSLVLTDIVYIDDISSISDEIKQCFVSEYPYALSTISSAIHNAVSIFRSISSIGHVLVEDK